MKDNNQTAKPMSKYAAKKQRRVSLWNDKFSKKQTGPKPFKPRPKFFQQKPTVKKPTPPQQPAPPLTLKEALVAMGYRDGVMKWPCCDPKIEGNHLTYRICQLNEIGREVWKKASISLINLKTQLEEREQFPLVSCLDMMNSSTNQ